VFVSLRHECRMSAKPGKIRLRRLMLQHVVVDRIGNL